MDEEDEEEEKKQDLEHIIIEMVNKATTPLISLYFDFTNF